MDGHDDQQHDIPGLFSQDTSMDEPLKDVADRHMPDRPRPPPPRTNHHDTIAKMIRELSGKYDTWQVFNDFVEMSAIAFSNAVDLRQREKREARYMEIVKRYKQDELLQFPKMLGEVIDALETEPSDVLGRVFHELELHNKFKGQFFTPMPVCSLMARIIADKEHTQALIAEHGFVRAEEPACGSGAMIIALSQAMRDDGINYQDHLHVTAVDTDIKCVHMAYVQFTLLYIPAIIVHGNSLSLEEFGHWYTMPHIRDGWNLKLKRDSAIRAAADLLRGEPGPDDGHDVDQQDPPEDNPLPLGPVTQLTLF